MGGIGSGRRRSESGRRKQTTDQLPALDVRHLKRCGMIHPDQERADFLWRFRRRAGATSPGPERAYEVVARLRLAWTPCNYGGSRPWFLCPGAGCGRRAAILYGPASPPLCRLCLGLAYASQRRAARKG